MSTSTNNALHLLQSTLSYLSLGDNKSYTDVFRNSRSLPPAPPLLQFLTSPFSRYSISVSGKLYRSRSDPQLHHSQP